MKQASDVVGSLCCLNSLVFCSKFALIKDYVDGSKPNAKNDFTLVQEYFVFNEPGFEFV